MPSERQAPPLRDREPRILYLGELNEERGAHELLDALSLVSARRPCTLAFAGRIVPDALRSTLEAHPAWRLVEDHGWLPQERIAELLDTSRVGVVPFRPLPNHVESQPRKLFEYMAAGLPVVATDFPHWREMVSDTGAGITVPCAPEPLAEALVSLLEDDDESEARGRAASTAARARFSWQSEEQRLLTAYEAALSAHRG